MTADASATVNHATVWYGCVVTFHFVSFFSIFSFPPFQSFFISCPTEGSVIFWPLNVSFASSYWFPSVRAVIHGNTQWHRMLSVESS